MAIDPTVNFGKVNVSTGYDASATSIDLSSGEGATLPDPGVDGAYNLTWWNAAAYPDPADDPNVEIVRITARSSDTLTVTRAQEGTSASTKNTSGGEYKMVLSPTKKTIDDIESDISAKFTLPSLTAGSILFADGSTIAQDNTNLFWDNTNNFFGIGTSSPDYAFELGSGQMALPDGTAADPSLTWTSQDSMGFFKNATNQLSLSVGGTVKFKYTTTGIEMTSDRALAWRSATNGSQGSADTFFWRNAASFVEMRDSTTANQFGVYNTYTDSSNYERAIFGFQQTANLLSIGTQAAGTGTLRDIALIGGNVGVGGTPTVNFEVFGTQMQLTSTANANIIINRAGTNRLGSMTYSTAGSASWYTGMPDSDVRGDGTEYFIGTSNSDPKLWIETNGNTGIGVENPGSRLVVKGAGTSSATGNLLLTDSAGTSLFEVNNAGFVGMGVTPSALWKLDFVGQYFQMGSDNTSNYLRTDATVKLFGIVTPHYNTAQSPVWGIGVQTTSVANNVFIGGGVTSGANAATSISFATGTTTTGGVGTVRMALASTLLRIGSGDATTTPAAVTLNGPRASGGTDIAGTHWTTVSGLATGNASSGDFIFQTGTPGSSGSTIQTATTRLIIEGDTGNVGIGTTTPAQKLDVTGYAQASTGFLPGTSSDLRLSRAASGTLLVDALSTGAAAVRIGYSATVYGTIGMTETTSGNMTLSTTGGSTGNILLAPLGNVLIGGSTSALSYNTTQQASSNRVTPILQNFGTAAANGVQAVARFSTAQTGPGFYFGKSAGSTVGDYSAVSSNHQLGNISFQGTDGTQLIEGAYIQGRVNGTVSTNVLPTDLRFATMNSAGTLGVALTLTGESQSVFANGSAALPSVTWTGSSTTGLWRVTTDTIGFAIAGAERARLNSTGLGVGVTPSGILSTGGDMSFSSWTTTGRNLGVLANTLTDTSSAAATTIATRVASGFATPTFASTNAITVTDAINLYVSNRPTAGTNTTITNGWALWVNAGDTHFGGDVRIEKTTGGILNLRRDDAAVASNDTIGILNWQTNDSTVTTQTSAGSIEVQATASYTTDATPSRMIFKTGTSTTATAPVQRMVINEQGYVGIGETTPLALLHLQGNTGLRMDADEDTQRFNVSYSDTLGATVSLRSGGGAITAVLSGESTAPTYFNASSVGIGTTAPDKALEINHATGGVLRLTYNDADGSATNKVDFDVSSSGDLTITPSGGDVAIAGDLNMGANTVYFTETDNGNSSTADTIDWGAGNKQRSTLTGNVTYTFTAPAGPCNLVLKILTGAGGFTATWPATVKWAGGVAPTITTTASRADIITFYYDGTNYYGSYVQDFTP